MNKKGKKKLLIVCISVIVLIILILMYFLFFKSPSLEELKQSVVKIEVYDIDDNLISTGSGVCVFENNYIATNFHVIEGAANIKIIDDNNKEYDTKSILIFDNINDLAILETNIKSIPVKIGKENKIKTGQKIYTIGSPRGELNTVSEGIISNADNTKGIQISAPISHGSSGGGLFNNNKELIGITYAGYDDAQNLNYAIRISYLNKLHDAYINGKYDIVNLNEINKNKYDDVYLMNDTQERLAISKGYKTISVENTSLYTEEKIDYIQPDSINTFYILTNKYNILDRAVDRQVELSTNYGNICYYWCSRYQQLSEKEKKQIADLYEELIKYETCFAGDGKMCDDNANIDTIDSWTNYQYVLETDLLTRFGLAVFLNDVKNFNSTTEYFNYINKLPLANYEKGILSILFGGFKPSMLSYNDAKSIVNDINRKIIYTDNDKKMLLKYLGYNINGNNITW